MRNLTVARREARERIERDLAEQLGVERGRSDSRAALASRVRAVAHAQRAFSRDQEGAREALRGSLLDLAAAAIAAAESIDLAEVEERVDEEPAPV